MGKLSKDRRDVYYRRAKEDGYRARSAYKLLQLDDQFHIFNSLNFSGDGFRAVDLCAAPGSWSQVLQRRLQTEYEKAKTTQQSVSSPVIVAVDLQEIAPIPGVIHLQGDITSQETVTHILSIFKGQKAHLVICDGAPDVTGMHDVDEYIQSQILFSALRIAIALLQPGSTFVAKIFRGENASLTYSQLYTFFDEVYCGKPSSSRVSSFEAFVVCKNFRCRLPINSLQPFVDLNLDEYTKENAEKEDVMWKYVVPFVACGDLQGFDSDTTFSLRNDHVFLEPTQPPINPPYRDAVAKKKNFV